MKTVVQLGRIGDILNILPLACVDAQRGDKWRLMVAAEYAPLLEGISYVEPLIYQGPHYEIAKAMDQARNGASGTIVCCQVNGPAEEVKSHVYGPANRSSATTTSFQKEQWAILGRLKEWDEVYPLVFDLRDYGREADLIEKVQPKGPGKKRKLLLVSPKGNSSPFPYTDLLMTLLHLKFPTWQIEELPQAERFFDLLALYERAHALVAIDSAPLHLARACPSLPVIALTNDKPMLWNGSSWQPNHIWYCRYSDFPQRAPEMLQALEDRDLWTHEPSIVMVHNNKQGKACGRFTEGLPMLKDCLRMGLQSGQTNTVVMLTRPGIELNRGTSMKLPGYAYRMNRNGEGDTFVPIPDLFCATKAWWREHLNEIPDYVLGNDYYWSNGLWALFRKHGANDITGCCYRTAKAESQP